MSNPSKRLKHNDKKAPAVPNLDRAGDSSLPFSSEMLGFMKNFINSTNEDGVISEAVGSHMSQPLSIESLFFPTAAIVQSAFAAAKPPNFNKTTNTNTTSVDLLHSWSNAGSLSQEYHSSLMNEPKDSIVERVDLDDYNSRLQVLWLKRKADLEKEDGLLVNAAQSLESAVSIHLGVTPDNYENARLSAVTMTNNPLELLSGINQNFFLYEPKIHNLADKIQRWYRKRFLRKVQLINTLIKCVRGFLVRNRNKKWKSIRLQCAKLIQRRFRHHLERMHRLATLIKHWFKNRKIANAYRRKLFMYQMARRIQKVFRGYLGRKKAALVKLRKQSALKIQRLVHRYFFGTQRNFIITRMHRKFFIAARKIQRMVRVKQAVERCRTKLLLELLRESVRLRKEFVVIQELLRNERIKQEFYMKTRFGRLQLEWQHHKTQLKEDMMIINKKKTEKNSKSTTEKTGKISSVKRDKKTGDANKKDKNSKQSKETESELIPSISHKTSSQTFVTPQIILLLDLYDEFDDGRVPWTKIKSLLHQLQVLVSDDLLDSLKVTLDAQDNGFFYLSDFLTWFDSTDADEHIIVQESKLFSFEKYLGPYSHKSRLDRKTRKKLLQEEMFLKFYRGHLLTLFRRDNPPKFHCCQCNQGFALFTDYYFHFEIQDNVGLCPVKKLKAMFFPKYWERKDSWKKQRQIEYEISRVNNEFNYVKFILRSQCFEEIKCWGSSHVQKHFEWLQDKMHSYFLELMKDLPPLEFCKKYCDVLMENMFPTPSINTVNGFMVRMLANALDLPVKKMWILEDGLSREETLGWISQNLPVLFEDIFEEKKPVKVNKVKKKAEKVDAGISDYGSNQNVFKQKRKKSTRRKKRSSKEIQEDYFEEKDYFSFNKPWFVYSQKTKFNEAIKRLCSLIFRILRLRMMEAQAGVMSLIEFRGLLPRMINMNDDELDDLQLPSLTARQFKQHYDFYVVLHDETIRKYGAFKSLKPPSAAKSCLGFVSQLLTRRNSSPSALEMEGLRTAAVIDKVENQPVVYRNSWDEYIYSNAKQAVLDLGPLGRMYLFDIAKLLRSIWQHWDTSKSGKYGILVEPNSNFPSPLRPLLLQLLFKYGLLQSLFLKEKIDLLTDPALFDRKIIHKDDISSVLEFDFGNLYESTELLRLKDVVSIQEVVSINDIANGTNSFIVKEKGIVRKFLSKWILALPFPNVIKDLVYLSHAREVVYIQSRCETRMKESVMDLVPRPEMDASYLWSDVNSYYQSLPRTFWFPITHVSNSDSGGLLSKIQAYQGWKHNREFLKHSKIMEMHQQSAQRKVWIGSRFNINGRKMITKDAILVDMANAFASAFLSVAIPPFNQEERDLLICTDPSGKSPVNRYFHRLLATVVEIWVRLFDSTCSGSFDAWEEQHFAKIFESTTALSFARVMQSQSSIKKSASRLDDDTSNSSINSMDPRLLKTICEPFASFITRPGSAVAIDTLQHAKWIVARNRKSIAMKSPNRIKFSRLMVTSVQRRLSKQLTQQTLIYTEFSTFTNNLSSFESDEKEDETDKPNPRFDASISSPISLREKRNSLIVRCQLLAMRQVKQLLKKTMGTIYCHLSSMREVETLWNQELLSSFPPLYSMWKRFTATYGFDIDNNNYGVPKSAAIIRDTIGVSTKLYRRNFTTSKDRSLEVDMVVFLKYCFYLHCEPQQFHPTEFPRMLTTEIPHVIRFIRDRQPHWILSPDATIPIIRMMRKSLSAEGVFWLTWDQFSSFVVPLFSPDKIKKQNQRNVSYIAFHKKDVSISSSTDTLTSSAAITLDYSHLQEDGIVRLYSRARQQAVLIALNVQDVTVPETNYRCMLLGLYDTAKQLLPEIFSRVPLKKEDQIPRELVPIYMLSQGYCCRDLFLFSHSYRPKSVAINGDLWSGSVTTEVSDAADANGDRRQMEKRDALFASFGDSSLLSIIPSQFIHGRLDYSTVIVEDVDRILQAKVWSSFSFLEISKRFTTFGAATSMALSERVRLQNALEMNSKDIERRGAQYLRELISGISQFSQI